MPRPLRAKAPLKRRRTAAPRPPRETRPEGPVWPYWLAGALLLLLIVGIACYVEQPWNRDHWSSWTSQASPPPATAEESAAAQHEQMQADEMMRHLQEKQDQQAMEKRRQAALARKEAAAAATAARAAATALPSVPKKTSTVTPSLVEVPMPTPNAPLPPLALPASGHPLRAMPANPDALTPERIAAYQVALERMHFSCGFIDGDQGMRTQRMLRAFQQSRGLPITGFLDPATRNAIGEPGEPFLTYRVTEDDIAALMPKPGSWREKARASRLGYNEIWEELAEKFHCTRGYLKLLNRDVPQPVAGSEIIGPKVFPAAPYPHAASLRVNLAETSIEALDGGGTVVAFFPCSIAADKNKRPNGRLYVKSVVPDPDYTFDPELFKDASAREGITHKMTLPPGPRNPVGTAWVGLSLPGYGIHGTPEPEKISATQSHGCFRLANWNANKVLRMVRVGTPVEVDP